MSDANIDEWDDDADTDEDAVEELETYFANVYEYVDQWVLPRYRRKPGTVRWDPDWFENIEALDRLEALWRAWEFYRLEGMTGMAVFWNDQFNPTMYELTNPEGTFWYVQEYTGDEEQQKPVKLPSNRPPVEDLA